MGTYLDRNRITSIETSIGHPLVNPEGINEIDLRDIADYIEELELDAANNEDIKESIEELQQIIDENANIEIEKLDLENRLDQTLDIIEELSAWMRDHTGPKDGTIKMLSRAVHFMEVERGKIE